MVSRRSSGSGVGEFHELAGACFGRWHGGRKRWPPGNPLSERQDLEHWALCSPVLWRTRTSILRRSWSSLIVAQRNYQANAKTVEIESAISQTIINLR